MIKVIAWEMVHSSQLWDGVVEMDADIALLQEALSFRYIIAERMNTDHQYWRTEGCNCKVSANVPIYNWSARHQTVFDHIATFGKRFVSPQSVNG